MVETSFSEQPVMFESDGDRMLGICHSPTPESSETGVLIAVGGPQYRVGSHRQFVLIARALAERGVATMRFDYRGMGDSEGSVSGFENCDRELFDALEAFRRIRPELTKVVLWGLCDAASTLAIYGHGNPQVAGLFLLNPWVRTEATLAETHVRQYYLRRMLSTEFWKKVLGGKLNVLRAMRSVAGDVGKALAGRFRRNVAHAETFPDRMLSGLQRFHGPVRVVMCGQDLTALEFRQVSERSGAWGELLGGPSVSVCELSDANHTFSREVWREKVVDWTMELVRAL